MNLTDVYAVKNCDGDFPLAGVDPNSDSLTEEMCAEDEISSIAGFEGIVGQSSALREVLQQVEMVNCSQEYSDDVLLTFWGSLINALPHLGHLRGSRVHRPQSC